jgi:hypothetical protein
MSKKKILAGATLKEPCGRGTEVVESKRLMFLKPLRLSVKRMASTNLTK